jgi:hypothetical protein
VTALHESVVQTLPSLQFGGGPPTQTPPLQVSAVVQALPSLQAAVLLALTQPVAGSHESVVQRFPSSQFGGGPPTQTPALQPSPTVQASPSLQAAVLLALTQPVAGSHESVVQTLPSSQLASGPATQMPPPHVSAAVQALPSSQAAVLLALTHPVAGSQESSVHRFPSSQFGGAPDTQRPPAQVSPTVQALPSLQAAVLFAFTQPVAGSHESSVHGLASLQARGAPGLQTPPPQASPTVQALPSSQGSVLFEKTQAPVPGLQESLVQGFPSSQTAGVPAQTPPAHTSPAVHRLPSSQAAVLLLLTHPVPNTQLSSVHTLPSSQLGGAPPTQAPPLQVSAVVHGSPSSQAAVLFVLTQPVAGLQESLVQIFPSLQFGAGPPAHAPPLQVSNVVQALPSSQAAALLVLTQPVAGSHESSVQVLPSSQFGGTPPTQTPPPQVSPVVQASPSLQATVLLVLTHPVAGSHESVVQILASSQPGGAPPTQRPALQVSPAVQALPSSQGAVLFTF